MVLLDVCMETVFTGLPVEERIEKIAQAGYRCIELWIHDATFDGKECSPSIPKDAAALRQVCATHGVTINNMVVNVPDGSFGGAPVRAEDLNRYLERLDEVIEFANAAGCSQAITCSGDLQPGLTRAQMHDNLQEALGRAAEIAAKRDFTLFLEPLNTHVDHPVYYLNSSGEGAEIVREIGLPSLRLLYDVYHMQVMEGNVTANIEKHIDVIGHFHSAGVPGRGELDDGELDYPKILDRIAEMDYQGCFGLEYFPKLEDNLLSLKRVRAYLEGE